MKEWSKIYKYLNPSRLRILRCLVDVKLPLWSIMESTRLTKGNTMHHLRSMELMGLVVSEVMKRHSYRGPEKGPGKPLTFWKLTPAGHEAANYFPGPADKSRRFLP